MVPKRSDITDVTQAKDSIGNQVTGTQIETIDIVKQMGDLLPPGIVLIAKPINEQKYEDPTDWFCKKFAGKPIAVIESPDPKEKKAKAKELAKEKEKAREEQKIKLEIDYKAYEEQQKQLKMEKKGSGAISRKESVSPTKVAVALGKRQSVSTEKDIPTTIPSSQLNLKEKQLLQLNKIVVSGNNKMFEV